MAVTWRYVSESVSSMNCSRMKSILRSFFFCLFCFSSTLEIAYAKENTSKKQIMAPAMESAAVDAGKSVERASVTAKGLTDTGRNKDAGDNALMGETKERKGLFADVLEVAKVAIPLFGILFVVYQWVKRTPAESEKILAQLRSKKQFDTKEKDEQDNIDYDRYQEILKEELGYIRMLGLPGIESVKVNLNDDTFVPLRLSDRQGKEVSLSPEKKIQQDHEGDAIFTPDKIMQRAFKKFRILLVTGDPGAGKTTLLKYYALCALDPERSLRLGFSNPVNVFYLPLRDLVSDKEGHFNDTLPINLKLWTEKHHLILEEKFFNERLQGGTSLVLLDGLDEISNTDKRIEVCRWIDAASCGFSKAYFVVTSRATGYRKDEGIELAADYERADVQDFSPEQQERFLKNWFNAAFLKESCDDGINEAEWTIRQRAKADERTRTIVAHLKEEKNKGLRQLASVPMILQIMAILWKDQDYMPESRVKLYEASLDYLLELRDKRRGIIPDFRDKRMHISAARARVVLAPVSLWMQEKLKTDEADKAEMHKKMEVWLADLDNPPSVEEFCDYLVKRAGLLVEYGAGKYVFRHKSFREYLASVELVKKVYRTTGHLDTLITGFGDDWWDEPIKFFVAQGDAATFDLFMEKLFDSPRSDALTEKQQLLLQIIINEAPLKKVDALCKKLLTPATTPHRQRVILDCLKAIGKPAALEFLHRFQAEKLAKNKDIASRTEEVILALNDQKSDHKPEMPERGNKVLPAPVNSQMINLEKCPSSFRNYNEYDTEYIRIQGGSYLNSLTGKEERVEDLYVAKYPVTNRLYRSFIAFLRPEREPQASQSAFIEIMERIAKSETWESGFHQYLHDGKGDLSSLFRSQYDEDRKFGGDDQPVVGITWYAARAYCLWLSLFEGDANLYRLPTEIEWEWVAGGRQGANGQKVREYPWAEEKGEPTSKLANFNGNVGATTPVGSYPDGATPEGLYDMAGNVWEWMENQYDEKTSARSLRGGSWYNKPEFLRCPVRDCCDPGGRNYYNGFRVVRPSHFLSA